MESKSLLQEKKKYSYKYFYFYNFNLCRKFDFFLKDERIRLVKENRKYDFWYVQKFDFKTKLYVMNYGFSLNDTVRLYHFNFKRHLIGWKWKIGSKDVSFVKKNLK